MSLDNEIWKDVIGYEGLYQVSNLGRIKSIDRHVIDKNGNERIYYGVIRKPFISAWGYKTLYLYKNNIGKGFVVHRLVAEAFLGKSDLPQVNHINGVKTDNWVENLEWCTQSENNIHAYKIGLSKIPDRVLKHGKDHPASVPVIQKDLSGNVIAEYDSVTLAAQANGYKANTISMSVSKKRKTAYGFTWERRSA